MDDMKISAALMRKYTANGSWKDKTLLDRWEAAVAVYGEKSFVIDDRGAELTYSRLDAMADSVATCLERQGVAQGDVVTFQITPRSEFVVALIACFKLGAVPAPLGMCFVDHELLDLADRLDTRFHISVESYRGADRTAQMESFRSNMPRLKGLLFVGEGQGSFGEIASRGDKPSRRPDCGANDLALLLCTSGTTKGSKAVMFTHNCVIYSEEVFDKAYGLTDKDRIFMPAPLNHATGLHHGIISPMLRGGSVVLQERFTCKEAIDLMNAHGCTYSMGATPFVYDIVKQMEESGKRLETMRFYICGGAPVPRELVRKAHSRFGLLICECYGSTESVPHVGVRPEECLKNDGQSAGKAMEGIEVIVVGKDRRPLPPGQVGEEASRGPNLFVGYKGSKDLTDEALDDEGWFYSGDLAVLDEAGNLKIVGRIKDLIVRGGENLNSNLINDNIEGYPGVVDHAVIGMPDERLGERICAFVVTDGCAPAPTVQSMREYLASKNVQKRLWPERIEAIDSIPRTESGKIKKNILSQELKRRMDKEAEKNES